MKKYNWASNRISEEDMAELYKIKEKDGIKITEQVAEAVKLYLKKRKI